ncbi:Stk1 family PASTA domain-containing Ser/Thr kinase [Bogoriella caseilytica]|uniref:non-specific serine/threonine protein kinase n=1 Tax=Bogoriella caseilytica TaxID=56055 RepID=A0A3N2B9G1_9MICO|nr:Stk1 family PASTA domain-containing Ser/Thr kinase [Bogoriella caseilytica]ROR71772.1 serine/threonine-protein kinase [Bogoriella caseilytica]
MEPVTTGDPLLGRVVEGRYEVTARIARGGMATVYRATDRRLDRTVALKVMHPHLAESPEFVARFRREARAAARLSHPGVVAVHDQGSTGEAVYLAMEHVPGPTLRDELARRGVLPLGEALRVAEQVLDALAAAHRAGLVHRDIKPENVLLSEVRGERRAKVADFGLARAVTEVTASTTGTILGTVAYLAPEIVTGGAAEPPSDVYATGVLLYELITGHQPFVGEAPIQVAFQHVNSTVRAPSEDVPWLPAEVDDLLAALTARSPEERPQDAGAALELVRTTLAQLDPATLARRADVAPPPEPSAASSQEAHDPGRTTAFQTHGTVALPRGAITAPPPPTAGVEPPPRRGRRRPLIIIAFLLMLAAAALTGTWWWLTYGPGSPTVVPEVSGRTEAEAVALLDAADLEASLSYAHDDDIAAGVVLSVDPSEGVERPRGSIVDLVISEGVLSHAVPQVAGRDREAAEAAITDAGLAVGEIGTTYDPEVPVGVVISSDPEAGTEIPHHQSVALVVSDGPEPIAVPGLSGATAEEAAAALDRAGLSLGSTIEEHHEEVPEGQVIRQSPDPDASLLPGESVDIAISLGPELFEVPDLVGEQVDQATDTLRDLGFEVEVETIWGGFFGSVRFVDPEPGTMLPRGSVVTLQVV